VLQGANSLDVINDPLGTHLTTLWRTAEPAVTASKTRTGVPTIHASLQKVAEQFDDCKPKAPDPTTGKVRGLATRRRVNRQ
jgi:hypothetical protein